MSSALRQRQPLKLFSCSLSKSADDKKSHGRFRLVSKSAILDAVTDPEFWNGGGGRVGGKVWVRAVPTSQKFFF